MSYIAHSENQEGRVHLLREHLLRTAERMREFSFSEELKPLLGIVGLLHDIGKYQEEFQDYLKKGGEKGSVPHAKWGAMLTRSNLINCTWFSFPIYGHHSGLPDHADWKPNTDLECDENLKKNLKAVLSHAKEDIPDIEEQIKKQWDEAKKVLDKYKDKKLAHDLMIRYIFSCLTDADWIDTDEHYFPEHGEHRSGRVLDPDAAQEKLDAHLREIESENAMNKLRAASRAQALSKAQDPLGFYSLHLPTGLGKTLTSFYWALMHAKKHGLKRIIIVLPYTSIIDQTAEILKDILGEDQVLEHHGGIIFEDSDKDQNKQDYIKKFAVENWNFPVIVTTSVQFFETLFSNKSSKCRKLHNIARSVVIFDEVQTLKKDIAAPTLKMLENVQDLFGCSFLFCTATMPVFQKRDKFDGLEKITPLIQDPQVLYNQVQRVTYHTLADLKEIDLFNVRERLLSVGQSALVIFNLKETTKNFYIQMRKEGVWEKVYHLSAFMCPKHRKEMIGLIRDDLHKQKKILVISTQLVEAGVDFDFPVVMRELGPLSSVIQAAGRCNREGKMGEGAGRVYIFLLKDTGYPGGEYKEEAEFTLEFIKEDPQRIHHLDLFQDYYQKVIDLYVKSKTEITNKREAYEKPEFKTIAQMYRVIEDTGTTAIFIRGYDSQSEKLYRRMAEKIKDGHKMSKEDRRHLQQYSVQVYNNFFQEAEGYYEPLGDQIYVWNGIYHKEIGITLKNIDEEENII